MDGLHITLAGPADSALVMGIISQCQQALLAQGIRQWTAEYPTAEDVRRDIASGMTYLLSSGRAPVATIALSPELPEPARGLPWLTHPPQRFLVVHRLCVLPQHRRKGYAKALMAFVDQVALEQRCVSVRLGVYSANPAAVALYETLGYQHIAEAVMPWRELPFLCMEKLF